MKEKREILPNALYKAREVAELLGFDRVDTIYAIPEDELVPTRVGPRRGRKMYRGHDVIRYLDRGRPRGAPKLADVA
jgi:hypothetical protein